MAAGPATTDRVCQADTLSWTWRLDENQSAARFLDDTVTELQSFIQGTGKDAVDVRDFLRIP